jgi:hypothetical protein
VDIVALQEEIRLRWRHDTLGRAQHRLQFQLPEPARLGQGKAETLAPLDDGGLPCPLSLFDISPEHIDKLLFQKTPVQRIGFDVSQRRLLDPPLPSRNELIQ